MNAKNTVLMAAIFTVISYIIHMVFAFMAMGYYTDPAYFPLWSSIMMPNNGPPGIEFTLLSISFSFITGLIFAAFYALVKPALKGGSGLKRGAFFGLLLFFVAAVPGTLSMILLLSIPTALVLIWAVENLIIFLIAGILFAKIEK